MLIILMNFMAKLMKRKIIIVADMLSDWKGYGPIYAFRLEGIWADICFQIGRDMGPISLNSLGRILFFLPILFFLFCFTEPEDRMINLVSSPLGSTVYPKPNCY